MHRLLVEHLAEELRSEPDHVDDVSCADQQVLVLMLRHAPGWAFEIDRGRLDNQLAVLDRDKPDTATATAGDAAGNADVGAAARAWHLDHRNHVAGLAGLQGDLGEN